MVNRKEKDVKQLDLFRELKSLANQKLFEIAMDSNARLKDRYGAAKELQRRKKEDEIHRNRSKYKDGFCGHK
jgi:hypothetical protein